MFQRHSAFKAKLRRGSFESGNRDGVIEGIVQPSQMGGLRGDDQFSSNQSQIVAGARTEHHAVFAERDRFAVPVDGGMLHREKAH
jgi:hypothetical protein